MRLFCKGKGFVGGHVDCGVDVRSIDFRSVNVRF